MRADFIRGTLKSPIDGIEILKKHDEGESHYADNRNMGTTQIHAEEPVHQLVEKIPDIVPYFHPFKYSAFRHLQQIMRLMVHPYQMMNPSRYHEMLNHDIEFFYRSAQSEKAQSQINHWDDVVRLAIATEPCYSPQIIGSIKYPP